MQAVDDAFVHFKIHGAVATTSGFLHQLQISGGAKLTPEIASVAGINVNNIGCTQRESVFQFNPVMDIDPGDLFGFHFHCLLPNSTDHLLAQRESLLLVLREHHLMTLLLMLGVKHGPVVAAVILDLQGVGAD